MVGMLRAVCNCSVGVTMVSDYRFLCSGSKDS